jgi:pimeloyl-ACP methyl ester carboxylesterase
MDISLQDVKTINGCSDLKAFLSSLMKTTYTDNRPLSSISPVAGLPFSSARALLVYDQEEEKIDRHAILRNMADCFSFVRYVEWLAKALVYKRPPVNSVIPNHTFLYYVRRIFCSPDKGLIGYLLEPVLGKSDAPAILAFKGSDFHPTGTAPISCMLSDIELNIGLSAFKSLEMDLAGMESPAAGQRKMVVCGHSLGGVAAQRFCAKFPGLVGELFLFNSPGIVAVKPQDKESGELFIRATTKHAFSVEIFVTDGDIVDRVSGLPLTTENTKVNVYSLGFWKGMLAHTYLALNDPLGYKPDSRQITGYGVGVYLETRYSKSLEFGRALLRGVFSVPLKLIAALPEPAWLKQRDAVLLAELADEQTGDEAKNAIELEEMDGDDA